ncbi:tail assembly chaperone [Microbacterium phage Zenitsu]|uniref:Tail assembly chaperone n=1 Tax=Microbacterium phage MCubed TaxID=2593339 RepID=A0A514U470_9CAUD|nr:tail assembly chaperone [Microbacterium phage MCubed]WNN93815.1 tail assembly chaperone [Microbacterium phage Zenitsu]
MSFATYEELKAAVEERRQDILTVEVDLGAKYSQEHEDAKKELAEANALKKLAGQSFLADNIAALEERVASTRPEPKSIWLQYKRLPISAWAMLTKSTGLSAIDQYEKVLPEVFIGVFGNDPTEEDENGNLVHYGLEPLTTDARAVSSRSDETILPGAMLHLVVNAFMSWQNSSGEISIRPTKSGRA